TTSGPRSPSDRPVLQIDIGRTLHFRCGTSVEIRRRLKLIREGLLKSSRGFVPWLSPWGLSPFTLFYIVGICIDAGQQGGNDRDVGMVGMVERSATHFGQKACRPQSQLLLPGRAPVFHRLAMRLCAGNLMCYRIE